MLTKISIGLLFLSSSAFALTLEPYIKLQDSLASDDFKASLVNFKALCDKDGKALSATYKDCSKSFKDIELMRTSFKSLSEIYIKTIPATDLKGAMKATCPMASARWIQKEGPLRNPYYGKTMLECGEKI